MAANTQVTSEQWEAVRTTFYEQLDSKAGMPDHKYNQIFEVIKNWDVLEPKERREMAGGNQAYWHHKYHVSNLGGKELLLMKPEGEAELHTEEDIQQSALHLFLSRPQWM